MITFSQLGRVLGLYGKKIYDWYKDYLSEFRTYKVQEELHKNDIVDPDIIDKKTGEIKTVAVPIFKSWNFGKEMSVDDKNIGGIGYLIFRNKKTGKIALMISTTKLKLVKKVLYKLPAKITFAVEKVTRDMASGYYWFFKEVFPQAVQIADKFHVIKHALDALQDVRVRYRQMFLTRRRKAYEAHKKDEKKRKKECEKRGDKFEKNKFKYKENTYENGETPLELLARSRYLLFQFTHQWNEYQKERAMILFREFPEIEKSYILCCRFRNWMKRDNIGENKEKLLQIIRPWFKDVEDQDIEEIVNFKSFVERNFHFIFNYFKSGDTNADAEGLNSQIQRFIGMNVGVKDRDFFHFRMERYFS